MFLAGTIGVFVTEANISTINAVFFRCFFAALLLGIYCWRKKLLNWHIFRSVELRYVIIGGIFLVANWAFLFQAFKHASITIGVVSYYTAPFFLISIGVFFLREFTTKSALLWTMLAFLGLLLISITGELSIVNNQSVLLGVGFGLVAAFFYACVTALGRKIQTLSPTLVVFIQMAIGTILLLPLVNHAEMVNGQINWIYVITLGVVHTALLYLLFYGAVRNVTIYVLAPLAFIDPLVAILSDVIVYRTTLTLLQIVGIAMILIASYFVSKEKAMPRQLKIPGDGAKPLPDTESPS
jgi:drug/metabolite transporter (DMT)-like permease